MHFTCVIHTHTHTHRITHTGEMEPIRDGLRNVLSAVLILTLASWSEIDLQWEMYAVSYDTHTHTHQRELKV